MKCFGPKRFRESRCRQHTSDFFKQSPIHPLGNPIRLRVARCGVVTVDAFTRTKVFAAQLHDGYVAYPWQKKMQELLSIPNSSCFLSILFLPKASERVPHRYNDLEDTLSRANAWHTASQASGVPILFMNIQTESLLTKVTKLSIVLCLLVISC